MNRQNSRQPRAAAWLGGTLAIVAIAALPAAATADDGTGTGTGIKLGPITNYATRNTQEAFDYAGQVTVIDRDRIEDLQPASVADVLKGVPGTEFQGGPRRSGEAPSLRGLSGEGVLILFDGARQSFISGHDGRFFIDPSLLSTVEVIRGPASALYGSGALGGVIAFETVDAQDFLAPGETTGLRLGTGYQTVNDEFLATATAFHANDSRTFDALASISYRDAGDIELGSGFTLPSQEEIVAGLAKAGGELAPGLSLEGSWLRYAGDTLDPNNPQDGNVASPGNEDVDREITSDTLRGALSYNPGGNAWVDANLVAYYTSNEVEESELLTTRVISREIETAGINIDNRSRFALGDAADLTLTYGGEYYTDDQTGRDNTTIDGTREGVPNAEASFAGAFVQAELGAETPIGAITLTPGLRWDYFESDVDGEAEVDDDAVSPKVGLTVEPLDGVLLFANWAEAFRAPSFNEMFPTGTHFRIPDLSSFPPSIVSNTFISNPDLEPEESTTWEAGIGFDLANVLASGDTLTAKGSYWQSDVDNLIDLEVNVPLSCFGVPIPVPCGSGEAFGNFSRNVNTERAELDGVEIEIDYDADVYYARATYSAIDGTDSASGEHVGVLFPNRFYLDAGVRVTGADLRLGARLTVADDFDEVNDPSEARDGYEVVDVYLVWEPEREALRGLRVDLGIDNIGDADYEIVNAGVSEPGRNLKLGLSWQTAW